jgi:hypothetical protein
MLFKYSEKNNTDKQYCFMHENYDGSINDTYFVERNELSEEPVVTKSYTFISDAPGHLKINDILQGIYKIPTYQRGYRWNSKNVCKLLEDIYEDKLYENMGRKIEMNIKKSGKFDSLKRHVARRDEDSDDLEIIDSYKYCIQPLVVMRKGRVNEYDVVDGQQRLTTIAVILSALKFCERMYGGGQSNEPEVQIEYESRPGSQEILRFISNIKLDITEEEIKDCSKENNKFKLRIWDAFQQEYNYGKNIDFEHIINSFQVSVTFFLDKMQDFKVAFGEDQLAQYCNYLQFVLLNCTEVIWYIADQAHGEQETIDERKIFANFNTGKLPLTNAELIKAMFMNPSNYGVKDSGSAVKDRQIVIAEKWDVIETELHNPDFWSFVPHPIQYDDNTRVSKYSDTRIDVIFDFLVMRKWIEKNSTGNYRYDVECYIVQHKGVLMDNYHTFNEIERWITDELHHAETPEIKREVMDKCWNEVRDIFTSLKEFYDDDGRNLENSSKLYNLIGFYIYANNTRKNNGIYYTSYKNNGVTNHVGDDAYLRIYGFLNELSKKPRSEREKRVKMEIQKFLELSSGQDIQEHLKRIRYDDKNSSSIAILLLLYNIAILNKSGGIGNRFHFSNYAKQTWQREHIFAQDENYLKDNKLIVERKAALQSLAKGVDNENIIAGLKENSFLQYINFKNNYALDHIPITEKDKEFNPISVDMSDVREYKKRNSSEIGYPKEYADALTARDQAKMLLDMYDWLKTAEAIHDEYCHYKLLGNDRLRASLVEKIHKYRKDNTTFFKNIGINALSYLNENIENYIKKGQNSYVFDQLRFNQNVLEKLQIDLQNIKNNPLTEFVSHKENIEVAKKDFTDWLSEVVEGETIGKLDSVNKLIQARYIKKLKEILWFNLDDRNKLFDMCDEGVNSQDLMNFYSTLRNKMNNNASDSFENENDDDIPDYDEVLNEDESIPEDSSKKNDNINKIKGEFEIYEPNIDYIMIAIKSQIENMSTKIDVFFERKYSYILNDHSMGNLTLLSSRINSSIKNKSYFEKCNEVYREFKKGSFIPLGTVLVFTDLYTKSLNSATQWLPESRLKYFKDLTDTLSHFFNGVEADER